MFSKVKKMNNDRYYEREERVKHIWVKEFHRLENLYAKIRKKSPSCRVTESPSFFILGVLETWCLYRNEKTSEL
jgi:hypothetical protein